MIEEMEIYSGLRGRSGRCGRGERSREDTTRLGEGATGQRGTVTRCAFGRLGKKHKGQERPSQGYFLQCFLSIHRVMEGGLGEMHASAPWRWEEVDTNKTLLCMAPFRSPEKPIPAEHRVCRLPRPSIQSTLLGLRASSWLVGLFLGISLGGVFRPTTP